MRKLLSYSLDPIVKRIGHAPCALLTRAAVILRFVLPLALVLLGVFVSVCLIIEYGWPGALVLVGLSLCTAKRPRA